MQNYHFGDKQYMTKSILGRAHNSLQECYSETTLRTPFLKTHLLPSNQQDSGTLPCCYHSSLHGTHGQRTSLSQTHIHARTNCTHLWAHTLHQHAHENKQLSAASFVCSGLHVLKQTHDCFLVLHRETNLSNIKLINIHTD